MQCRSLTLGALSSSQGKCLGPGVGADGPEELKLLGDKLPRGMQLGFESNTWRANIAWLAAWQASNNYVDGTTSL